MSESFLFDKSGRIPYLPIADSARGLKDIFALPYFLYGTQKKTTKGLNTAKQKQTHKREKKKGRGTTCCWITGLVKRDQLSI